MKKHPKSILKTSLKKIGKFSAGVLLVSTAALLLTYLSLPYSNNLTKNKNRKTKTEKEKRELGETVYAINDEQTTQLVNLFSGHSNQQQRENQMALLGYDRESLPKRDSTQINKAFYKSLRETLQLCHSPHISITEDGGDYKHWSKGAGAYMNHLSHRVNLYRLLNNTQQRSDDQKRVFTSDFASTEAFRQEMFKRLWGELAHSYALGKQGHSYINHFLIDAIPELVYDEDPYEKKTEPFHQTQIAFEEVMNASQDTIRRISYPQEKVERKEKKLKKEHLILTLGMTNRHLSKKKYQESYADTTAFEGGIHLLDEPAMIEVFLQKYESFMDRNDERELFDYANILLGHYTHKPLDTEKGLALMKNLANDAMPEAMIFLHNHHAAINEQKKETSDDNDKGKNQETTNKLIMLGRQRQVAEKVLKIEYCDPPPYKTVKFWGKDVILVPCRGEKKEH